MNIRTIFFALTPVFLSAFLATVSAQIPLELSLSTFNIRYDNPSDPLVWGDRKDEVAKAIMYFDIVGLQEALPNQLDDIRENLPWMSIYSETRNGNGFGEACPILWQTKHFDLLHAETRWLSESWSDTASIGWDATMPRIASIVSLHHKETGVIIRVINSHWSHVGEEARKASASLIRSWSMRGEADVVVVLGDFNAEPKSEEMEFLLSTNLKDAYETAKNRCRKSFGTFTSFNPAGFAGPRIDYILVDGAEVSWICADEYIKHGFYISDHLPVHAFILLKSQ